MNDSLEKPIIYPIQSKGTSEANATQDTQFRTTVAMLRAREGVKPKARGSPLTPIVRPGIPQRCYYLTVVHGWEGKRE